MLILTLLFIFVKGNIRKEVSNISFGIFLKDEILNITFPDSPLNQRINRKSIQLVEQTKLLDGVEGFFNDLPKRYYFISIDTQREDNFYVKVETKKYSFFFIVKNKIVELRRACHLQKVSDLLLKTRLYYCIKQPCIEDGCMFDCIVDEDISTFTHLYRDWEITYHSSYFERAKNHFESTICEMYDSFVDIYNNYCLRFSIESDRREFTKECVVDCCNKVRNMEIFTKEENTKSEFVNEIIKEVNEILKEPKDLLHEVLTTFRKLNDLTGSLEEQKILDLYSEFYTLKSITKILTFIYDFGRNAKHHKENELNKEELKTMLERRVFLLND